MKNVCVLFVCAIIGFVYHLWLKSVCWEHTVWWGRLEWLLWEKWFLRLRRSWVNT